MTRNNITHSNHAASNPSVNNRSDDYTNHCFQVPLHAHRVTGGVFLIEFFLVKRFARTNISKLVDGVPNNVHASFFVNSTGIRLSVLFPKLLYLVGDLIRQVHASLVLRFKSLFDVVLHFVSDYLLAAR